MSWGVFNRASDLLKSSLISNESQLSSAHCFIHLVNNTEYIELVQYDPPREELARNLTGSLFLLIATSSPIIQIYTLNLLPHLSASLSQDDNTKIYASLLMRLAPKQCRWHLSKLSTSLPCPMSVFSLFNSLFSFTVTKDQFWILNSRPSWPMPDPRQHLTGLVVPSTDPQKLVRQKKYQCTFMCCLGSHEILLSYDSIICVWSDSSTKNHAKYHNAGLWCPWQKR